MKESVKKEIEELIEKLELCCSVEEFKNKIKWGLISSWQKLSEDFIREFKDKVNWYSISSDQTLSEDFIREFKDYVIWYEVSRYQVFSNEFYQEFKDKINIDYLKNNKNIDMDIKIKIKSETKQGIPVSSRFEILDL